MTLHILALKLASQGGLFAALRGLQCLQKTPRAARSSEAEARDFASSLRRLIYS